LLANSIRPSRNRCSSKIDDWLTVISGSRRLKHGLDGEGVENAIFNIWNGDNSTLLKCINFTSLMIATHLICVALNWQFSLVSEIK
jgi:hypothetical protein